MISQHTYVSFFYFIACERGTYGQKCNQNCGSCLHEDECFHVNGTCLTGCKPGFKGDLCKKRIYS